PAPFDTVFLLLPCTLWHSITQPSPALCGIAFLRCALLFLAQYSSAPASFDTVFLLLPCTIWHSIAQPSPALCGIEF
ncbi:hypothetical protein NDU88_001617, partial [Pleurodeles waltl]